MADQYVYYEHDNAFYRKRAGSDANAPIEDVLSGDGWVPYEGRDPIAPVFYGQRISESDLPVRGR